MRILLWALLWILQVSAQAPGVVTGFVKTSAGIPAAGVRVYAVPARDPTDAVSGTVFEGLTETGRDGVYRLEVPPGRYYLAAGSVQTPTYFPGVSDIRAARVFEISSGGLLEAVNFASFNPAPPPAPIDAGFAAYSAALLATLGQLSGTVRHADGSPVAGSVVIVMPAGATTQSTTAKFRATTDAVGRYRFTALLPGSYHIVTGYAEQPVFFPGVRLFGEAKTVTVAAATSIDTGDIAIPLSPPGVTIQGKIVSPAGAPIEGADVRLVLRSNSALPVSLPQRPLTRDLSLPDGSFELKDILAGTYDLEVRVSGIVPVVREIVVRNEPIYGIDVPVPVTLLSGRISMADGSRVPDLPRINAVVASSMGNSNLVTTTTFPVNAVGEFSRVIEPGKFRVFFEALPNVYEIVSMKAGETDLLKEDLEVAGSSELTLDIRLARKDGPRPGELPVKD